MDAPQQNPLPIMTLDEMRAIRDTQGLVRGLSTRRVELVESKTQDCSLVPTPLVKAVLRVGVKAAFEAILDMSPPCEIRLCKFMPDIVRLGTADNIREALNVPETFSSGVGDFWSDDAIIEALLAAVQRADNDIYQEVKFWFDYDTENAYKSWDVIQDHIENAISDDALSAQMQGLATLFTHSSNEVRRLTRELNAAREMIDDQKARSLGRLRADVRHLRVGLVEIAQTQAAEGAISDAAATVTLPAKKRGDSHYYRLKDLVEAVRFHPGAKRHKRCKANFVATAASLA